MSDINELKAKREQLATKIAELDAKIAEAEKPERFPVGSEVLVKAKVVNINRGGRPEDKLYSHNLSIDGRNAAWVRESDLVPMPAPLTPERIEAALREQQKAWPILVWPILEQFSLPTFAAILAEKLGAVAESPPDEATCRDVLSSLSSWLGGGLGDDKTKPSDYEQRIRGEIDRHIAVTDHAAALAAKDAEIERLREQLANAVKMLSDVMQDASEGNRKGRALDLLPKKTIERARELLGRFEPTKGPDQ